MIGISRFDSIHVLGDGDLIIAAPDPMDNLGGFRSVPCVGFWEGELDVCVALTESAFHELNQTRGCFQYQKAVLHLTRQWSWSWTATVVERQDTLAGSRFRRNPLLPPAGWFGRATRELAMTKPGWTYFPGDGHYYIVR